MNPLLRTVNGQPILTAISNIDPIQEKLFSFSSLPDGWHYGRGHAPPYTVILSAIAVAKQLDNLGARKIEVFPGVNGTVLISAFGQKICVDVTVSDRNTVDYVVEEGDTEIESQENVDFGLFLELISEKGWLSCDSSDSCTQSTTAQKNDALPQWHLKTPTEPVFRWSTNPALRIRA